MDTLGHRERKKARTKALIQEQALKLFKKQGYQDTTIEQIATSADISPRTFFRYFPAKEAVVLHDSLDPIMIDSFRSQPQDISCIEALRRAAADTFTTIPKERMELELMRAELIRQVPELRATMVEEYSRNVAMLSELIAERTGRSVNDHLVLAFAGAVVGVGIAIVLEEKWEPQNTELFDELLGYLEKGFSF